MSLSSKLIANEKQNIVRFLKSVSTKNYNEANKYLQAVVECKLVKRMKKAAKQKLF